MNLRMTGIFGLIFCSLTGVVAVASFFETASHYVLIYFLNIKGVISYLMLAGIAECFSVYLSMLAYIGGRHSPKLAIGRIRKLVVDLVTLCAALATKHLLEYDVYYLRTLVLCTLYFHGLWQLSHGAGGVGDFGFWDMVVEVALQAMVCLCGSNFYISISSLILCAAIIFYRCWSYKAPTTFSDPTLRAENSQC